MQLRLAVDDKREIDTAFLADPDEIRLILQGIQEAQSRSGRSAIYESSAKEHRPHSVLAHSREQDHRDGPGNRRVGATIGLVERIPRDVEAVERRVLRRAFPLTYQGEDIMQHWQQHRTVSVAGISE